MPRLITENKVYSFNADRGTKTIEKRETSTGWEDTAVYSDPLFENDIVTLSTDGDYTVKKAKKNDVIIGRITRMLKPKINEDTNECQVELYGDMYEMPLLTANKVIANASEVKLTADGVDSGAGGLYTLEAMAANDVKEVVDVFKPSVGKME